VSDAEFDGFREIMLSSIVVDRPGASVPARDAAVAELRIPMVTSEAAFDPGRCGRRPAATPTRCSPR
jgi:hypothetical protein